MYVILCTFGQPSIIVKGNGDAEMFNTEQEASDFGDDELQDGYWQVVKLDTQYSTF